MKAYKLFSQNEMAKKAMAELEEQLMTESNGYIRQLIENEIQQRRKDQEKFKTGECFRFSDNSLQHSFGRFSRDPIMGFFVIIIFILFFQPLLFIYQMVSIKFLAWFTLVIRCIFIQEHQISDATSKFYPSLCLIILPN